MHTSNTLLYTQNWKKNSSAYASVLDRFWYVAICWLKRQGVTGPILNVFITYSYRIMAYWQRLGELVYKNGLHRRNPSVFQTPCYFFFFGMTVMLTLRFLVRLWFKSLSGSLLIILHYNRTRIRSVSITVIPKKRRKKTNKKNTWSLEHWRIPPVKPIFIYQFP